MTLIPAAGGSQGFLHDPTGPEEDLIDRAARESMPGQTAPVEQRVMRLMPAQPLTGLPAVSRRSVVTQAGATLGIGTITAPVVGSCCWPPWMARVAKSRRFLPVGPWSSFTRRASGG